MYHLPQFLFFRDSRALFCKYKKRKVETMKNNTGRKLLSLVLTLAMLFSSLPASALAAEAEAWSTPAAGAEEASGAGEQADAAAETAEAGGEEDPQAPGTSTESGRVTATVSFTAQAYNAFLCAPQWDVSVGSDLAESYGYTDFVKDGVSVLDVLVRAHEVIFGADFTRETCGAYLAVSNGWASLVFGDSSGFSFALNGAQPNDGVYNEVYQGYTGYTVDQALVQDGDALEFMFYQDAYYLDYYVWFLQNGGRTLTAGAGQTLELTLEGYCFCYYGCSPQETIDRMTAPMEGAQLAWVDPNTGALTEIDGAVTDAEGAVTITAPGKAGTYYLTAYTAGEDAVPNFLPLQALTVQSAPTSITVRCESEHMLDGKLVAAPGDRFQLKAYDQEGRETPVTWSTSASSYTITLDEDSGVFTVNSASFGSASYLYFTAVSTLNPAVTSGEQKFELTGYQFSSYQRSQTVALSADGQTVKTISLSAGCKDHSIWSYDEEAARGVAALAGDPGNGTSIRFNALRPGSFQVTVALDFAPDMTDTATITITGVAVEDGEGNQGKTYLKVGSGEPNPTVQLAAFCAAERVITGWSSGNEAVATVDENGLVTAHGVGTALITATDSEGTAGGIKVVVSSSEKPYFESLEFLTTAFTSGAWVKDVTFAPTTLSYDLPIRSYSTTKLTLQATTLYDTEAYTATARYVDVNGVEQSVRVNSGAVTYLEGIPFDASEMTITLADKQSPEHQTVYTFHVTRPRDTSKNIKSGGIVLAPEGRGLLPTKYDGYAEGTMRKADENGVPTSGTGVTAAQPYYRTCLLDGAEAFALTFTGSTEYTHLRYSTDGGASWTELPQGGGATGRITFAAGETVAEVRVQILDDQTYSERVKAGQDGFSDAEPSTYTVWVEQIGQVSDSAQILAASTETGDWYPEFASGLYTYNVVMPNGSAGLPLTYTVTEGAVVKLGGAEQVPDENGVYTLNLKNTAQTLTVVSADGLTTNAYSFRLLAKSKYDVPDRVVDYLCINSQYTNISYGVQPETTLAGTLKSLGNFGGYITYYYEQPLVDDARNPYGIDFYVYGNSFANGGSAAESGQVWVSEDGETWYALAGSEHYEDSTLWDYSVTYTKTASGKTAWVDNQGNSNDGASKCGNWPNPSVYYLNSQAGGDTITLSGILLPCIDGTIQGDSSTNSFVAATRFGYVDYFVNGTAGAAANPYTEEAASNGFDLAWAVDEQGNPVDVSDKAFHYVKVVTASNIWAGAFNEKSTEVSQVVRAYAGDAEAGATSAPAGITISDANGVEADCRISIVEGQQVYSADLGDMKYITLSVDGAAEDDNIYINNQRVAAGKAATGIKVTAESGEKLVRVIVQNGEKEPAIYLLKLTSSAESSNELVEDLKVTVDGAITHAHTADGETYTLSVGSGVEQVGIAAVVAPGTEYTVNGEAPAASYALEEGENVFTIAATLGDRTQTITLVITRAAKAPVSSDTITVSFALFGDEKHGDGGEAHTYFAKNLEEWIAAEDYTVSAEATVLDVFELVLSEKGFTWDNAGGNYITAINDLAAFDNGSNSGWMYQLNGAYPSLGIAEQLLKDGDAIVFHYTDDWSGEDYSGGDTPDVPPTPVDAGVEDIYRTTGAYLAGTVTNPIVSSVGGDWTVLGLARAGYPVPEGYYEIYYANVVQALRENNGVLDSRKYTEYSRVILGLTAAGYDARDVAGYNLLEPLGDYDQVVWQGVNGPIYALLALDSAQYEIPAAPAGKNQTTRENLVLTILEKQLADGGWALSGSEADPDVTAMAIQALAPYCEGDAAVRAAVDHALDRLSKMQNSSGGFSSWDATNSESCAQVIVALTALGIDPDRDERFVKEGHSVLDALCAYYVSGGGFRHIAEGQLDGMATEQGYYALASYFRLKEGKTSLYDMTDVTLRKGGAPDNSGRQPGDGGAGSPATGDTAAPVLGSALLLISMLGALLLSKKKKRA